ncbi:MAG: aspartate-semialdehyde dehydrogenase [Chlamydiae bacterium]|nr:aspartate-semialdehyde dehydrogenase [Chlamydiota bacterium]
MQNSITVGIVGATGAVGVEILSLLASRKFPVKELKLFASEKSVGMQVTFRNEKISVQSLNATCFKGCDIVFFTAGSKISKAYAEIAKNAGAIVIDNSSAFRMEKDVPLIIPEINAKALAFHKGIIANPNCATIIMLMAIAPLHKVAKIKRIVAATYQAASGAGAKGMHDLIEETKAHLGGTEYTRSVIPFPYAFNLFLHNSELQENSYTDEELKMVYETRKILGDDSIRVTATCVRVPVLRAHSEALNVEFHTPLSSKKAYEILKNTPGVTIYEDREKNRFPMPQDAVGQDNIFCGRIREDLSQDNTLDLWVVGDQLLKGAALNAVQIAELLLSKIEFTSPRKTKVLEESHAI